MLFPRMQVIFLAFTPAFLHMKFKPYIMLHNINNYQSWHIVFVQGRYYTVALLYLMYYTKNCHFKGQPSTIFNGSCLFVRNLFALVVIKHYSVIVLTEHLIAWSIFSMFIGYLFQVCFCCFVLLRFFPVTVISNFVNCSFHFTTRWFSCGGDHQRYVHLVEDG